MNALTKSPWRHWRWVAAAATVVTIGGAAGAIALARGDDAPSLRYDDQDRVTATAEACHQWLDEGPGGSEPGPAWCDEMATWMADELARGPVAHDSPWDNSQAMAGMCRGWVASSGDASMMHHDAESAGWCDETAAWMSQHIGTWHDAHDWDDHMGDGGWHHRSHGR